MRRGCALAKTKLTSTGCAFQTTKSTSTIRTVSPAMALAARRLRARSISPNARSGCAGTRAGSAPAASVGGAGAAVGSEGGPPGSAPLPRSLPPTGSSPVTSPASVLRFDAEILSPPAHGSGSAAARLIRLRGRRHDADRAIVLQHGQLDGGDVGDPVLSHGHLEVLLGEPLPAHGSDQRMAVLDHHRGLALEEPAEERSGEAEDRQPPVEEQQNAGGDESSLEGDVGPDHGVLHRVRDEEDQHEVEHGHLPQLALAQQAEPDQQAHIDERGADHDLPQRRAEMKHQSLLTDVGAHDTAAARWLRPAV